MSGGSGHARGMTGRRRLRLLAFRLRNLGKRAFHCPICDYRGPFVDVEPDTGHRRHARCPACGSLERHRLQYLVLREVLGGWDTAGRRVLHVAPEDFFRTLLSGLFGRYHTADLDRGDVDLRMDLGRSPFSGGVFDCVFASHVLEHIPDDRAAIREVRRVLAPGGIAFLPVPVVAEATIEYPEPNPFEAGHVRAPGPDYFDRFRGVFSRVEIYRSSSFSERHQTFLHEDRTLWPTRECPLRPAMEGRRHEDFVPVCHA